MPKCPNCGQEALRTEDWACQWCGYPLTSPAFKKIDKTWKEIKDGGPGGEKPFDFQRPAVPSEPSEDVSKEIPVLKSELGVKPPPKVEPPRRPAVKPEPVPEIREESRPVARLAPQPEPIAEVEQPVVELKSPPPPSEVLITPPPVVRQEVPPPVKSEPVVMSVQQPPPAPVPQPKPVAEPVIALTVDELLSAYMLNDVSAHEKFTDKTLSVTGIVGKVMVNDARAVYSVFLSSAEISGFRDVECRFPQQYASIISQAKPGQKVTIQGKYFGYVINVILRSCELVG